MTTSLPELPRKLNKREANITPRVIKWFQKNYPDSVALEIKVSKNDRSVDPSALKPHQRLALIAAKSDYGIGYKISDVGHVRLPFDCFVMKKQQAFVVCCFPKRGICYALAPETFNGFHLPQSYLFQLVLAEGEAEA